MDRTDGTDQLRLGVDLNSTRAVGRLPTVRSVSSVAIEVKRNRNIYQDFKCREAPIIDDDYIHARYEPSYKHH